MRDGEIEQALGRLVRDDDDAAVASLHQRLVGAQIEVAFGRLAVAFEAAVFEDLVDLTGTLLLVLGGRRQGSARNDQRGSQDASGSAYGAALHA